MRLEFYPDSSENKYINLQRLAYAVPSKKDARLGGDTT